MNEFSSLATRSATLRDNRDKVSGKVIVRNQVYGLSVHTTGSGDWLKNALNAGVDPLQKVVNMYLIPGRFCPGYVLGYDGTLIQIAKDSSVTFHSGNDDTVGTWESKKTAYKNGTWKNKVSLPTYNLWVQRWGLDKNPTSLYPSTNVNYDYIGVEMVPIMNGSAEPAFPGSLFTIQQHRMVGLLYLDLASRHGFNATEKTRLVGHEDVNPIDRFDSDGGWDPGFIRYSRYFDWSLTGIGLFGGGGSGSGGGGGGGGSTPKEESILPKVLVGLSLAFGIGALLHYRRRSNE
jgi:hypothetical protein